MDATLVSLPGNFFFSTIDITVLDITSKLGTTAENHG